MSKDLPPTFCLADADALEKALAAREAGAPIADARLTRLFAILDAGQAPPPPADLVERTLARLPDASNAGAIRPRLSPFYIAGSIAAALLLCASVTLIAMQNRSGPTSSGSAIDKAIEPVNHTPPAPVSSEQALRRALGDDTMIRPLPDQKDHAAPAESKPAVAPQP